MHILVNRHLKWILFLYSLTLHLFLTWKAFEFNWVLLEIAAMGPMLVFETAGMTSCHEFICLPSAAGWMFCLVVWSGIHYLAARLLSILVMRRDSEEV